MEHGVSGVHGWDGGVKGWGGPRAGREGKTKQVAQPGKIKRAGKIKRRRKEKKIGGLVLAQFRVRDFYVVFLYLKFKFKFEFLIKGFCN